MQTNKPNLIVDLTFEFAIEVIRFAELLNEKRKFVVANQLLKAGTSIGANVREAQNAESKADFIHKMKIAAKEADETCYWLLLCKATYDYPEPVMMLSKCESINKILSKIIASAKVKNGN